MKRPSLRSVFLLALTLTAGCQSAMSVEEAKRVTASFSSTSFVPPPRMINDITTLLDQQKRADPNIAVRARARADEPPPKTNDPVNLMKFYGSRANAAEQIGRAGQVIADLEQAAQWARRAGARIDEIQIWKDLGQAASAGGEASRVLAQLREAIALGPAKKTDGSRIMLGQTMARLAAAVGDLDTARTAAADAERAFLETLAKGGKQRGFFRWASNAAVARAVAADVNGQYREAEAAWREAIEGGRQDPGWAQSVYQDVYAERMRLWLAANLTAQDRLLEAENEARAALRSFLAKRGRDSPETASAVRSLAQVLSAQGRDGEAEQLLRAAVDIYEKAGVAPGAVSLAQTRSALGAALVAQGRWNAGLEEYERIRAVLANDPVASEQFLGANVGWAVALLQGGEPGRAAAVLERARAQRARVVGDRHPQVAEIRGLIAMTLAARGQRAEALREFAEATLVLLGALGTRDDDESAGRGAREQRLRMILSAYVDLLAGIRATPLEQQANLDATAEAFRVADVIRMGAVQHALDLSAARAAAKTPALAGLARPEQDASQQIRALQGLLANVLSEPPNQQDTKVIESLRQQIATLARARQALRQQIEREFPTYAELVNPKPVTLAQAKAALRPGEALIATLTVPERTFVWAVPASGPVAFAAVPLGERGLATSVANLRKSLEPSVRVVGDIPPFDVVGAYGLYRSLLEPVKAGWAGASSLLVVAHGPLSQLPPALLPTAPTALGPEPGPLFSNYRSVPWLIRTHAVTVLPSVASLTTLRALAPGDPSRRAFVGFGNPYFSEEQARRASAEPSGAAPVAALDTRGARLTIRSSPKTREMASGRLAALPPLPETADEIRSMALSMHADRNRDVFLGERANEQTVRTLDLSGYRVIAFATHGLSPGDLDGLTQPALALSAPEVTKVEGDGLLTMEKILALRLNADWVVLSACNTASGQGAGAEAISGLGRAFFYAGARALLVSNWPVETTSAKALTTDLFRRQAADPKLTRAQALQQTLNALIDGGEYVDSQSKHTVFSYAHPIFWAPFTLVGDGGATAKP